MTDLTLLTKAEAIAGFGSVARLAAAIDVSVQAIYKWPDEVPHLRAYQIRALLAEQEAPAQSGVEAANA